ncbi:reticulon-2a [Hypomesus transpacificus]|uniref:reticulon-2a n=1 Tax=Hypomesus transpacificus TaxID=137520 RepID=UPI001F088568|nr:reticulon-2a [Hypomesus transpacificus]
MGQVLGFSNCKELGSVNSTPDSTPPCTDGGNEESELYELQTAHDWSEEEERDRGGEDEDYDDDGDLASSPSIWGTPHQHSFELTFSYIAIAEAEAVGATRHHREGSGRRRGGARLGRTPLVRTDTLETLLPLDSPDVEWDPHAFLTLEEAEEGARRRREEEEEESERRERLAESEAGPRQSSLLDGDLEALERNVTLGRERGRRESPQHHHATQPPELLETLVTVDATIMLLTPIRPGGGASSIVSSTSSAPIGHTQELLVSEQWFSALSLSEGPTICAHIAVMDLIYWKDTERTGMVFTGLVVGLLSLFQLSLITVVSSLSLAAMCFTISVRLYYKVLSLINVGDGKHPFKAYLDMDISLSGEQADQYMQRAIVLAVSAVNTLKGLICVGSFFDSLKFLALVYLVTYLGDLCNGLTLLIIGVIAVFSVPLFYRQRQEQVDSVIARIQANIDNIKDILQRIAQGGGPLPDPTPGGAKPKDQ